MNHLRILTKKLLYAGLVSWLAVASCSQDDLLKEVPQGFLSPENVFQNREGFESALGNLYVLGRALRTAELIPGEGDKAITAMYASGTDLGWYWDKKLFFGDYTLINSNTTLSIGYWDNLFLMVKDANMILSRLEGSPLPEEEKLAIAAEARFFRAYAYRHLAHLFGDVPKIDEEIKEPQLDFTRTPKSEILDFMIEDLEFASTHLPAVNPGDGHLAKAAADHILAETYIATNAFGKAIEAATRVIDDGQYALMTQRFGTHADKPGDVFWDLFRLGNQNPNTGNTESILVWQMEYGVPGGEAPYRFEREWGPFLEQLRDSYGNKAIIPADSIGRPIAFLIPSPYMETEIWQSDFNNDIRNSKYNMQRVFYNNNPDSPEFGMVIVPSAAAKYRSHFVWVKKASHPHGHPQGFDQNGRLFSDIYAIRLAETYLLRAEAHLRNNDPGSAADDINVVRERAHATPVEPADVDIDYLLDERARELLGEEPRRLTLARMDLLYDRVIRYNAISAPTIQPFNNLLPIPQNQIDRTERGAEAFPQNTGYK